MQLEIVIDDLGKILYERITCALTYRTYIRIIKKEESNMFSNERRCCHESDISTRL